MAKKNSKEDILAFLNAKFSKFEKPTDKKREVKSTEKSRSG